MRTAHAIALSLLLLAAAACGGGTEQVDPEVRQEIEALLEAYGPKLGQAYSQNDPSVLEGLAAPREIAAIEKRMRDIQLEGRRLEPTFRSVTIEDLQVWGYANAYVTTQEVWDVRTYATGVDEQLTEQIGERNRVKYQLKKIDGDWMVLFRTILDQ